MLIMFGAALLKPICSKGIHPIQNNNEHNSSENGEPGAEDTISHQIANRGHVPPQATALIQALTNMSLMNNNRSNPSLYRRLLNDWVRAWPLQTWDRLPSTRFVL